MKAGDLNKRITFQHQTKAPDGLGGFTTTWGEHIYIAKEGSASVPQRIYCYNVVSNEIHPFSTDWYLGGAAVIGNKVWIHDLSSVGLIKWLYVLQSTSTVLRRIMIY